MAAVLALLGLPGGVGVACSADSVDEPEPTPTTPGVFLAMGEGAGPYALWRILGEFRSNYDSVYWVRTYRGLAGDLDEARAMARDPELPVDLRLLMATPADLQNARVVWFRSLDEEELADLR